ncbi:hypothetical protein L484_021337 [Morus notabilis]|uniref:Uncharacterized protein n=1 Tax=Morus notabilis TaxID=981085 RepID=W9S854_9ROSA|nr:hypothetical protein L484_021337 [Morus notabilis]
MAAATRTSLLSLYMAVLLLLHSIGFTSSSRPLHVVHPPVNVLGGPPYKSKPRPPSTKWFSVNHYKIAETDAFRPTAPGHSPGVGHGSPPS